MNCEKYLSVIPWPQFALALLLGFLVGGTLGFWVGRHTASRSSREQGETMKAPSRHDWRILYERVAPMLVVFCIFCSMFASVGVFVQSRTNAAQDKAARVANSERTKDNAKNQVIGCQNANESRRASLALWTFLFSTSLKNPNTTPAQKRNIRAIEDWIGILYADRDCSDLSKKYPIPPPPVITPAQ